MIIKLDVVKSPSFLLKVLQLALAAVCVGLAAGMGGMSLSRYELVFSTFSGFLMVACVIIAASLLNTPVHSYLTMAVSAVAVVMFIVAGAFCIDASGRGELLGAGIIAILNAVVYAADIAFTYKYHAI